MIWPTNLCRICAQIRNICIPIFQKSVEVGIDVKIKRSLSLNVSQEDLKPQHVCEDCLIKLNDFYSFVIMYWESNHRFEMLLNTSPTGPLIEDTMELGCPSHSIKTDNIGHLSMIDQCKEIVPLNDIDVESQDVEQNLLNEIVAKVDIDLENLVASDDVIYTSSQNDPVITYLGIPSGPVSESTAAKENVQNSETKKPGKVKIISVKTLCEPYKKALGGKTASSKNSYPCIKCGKIFSRRHCLNEHFKKHSDSRPYVCDCCGKGFILQSDLTCHKHVHTDLFGCKFCGKRFTAPSKLQRHVRTHTGEKPFRCDVKNCGRSFSDKCNLIGHQLTHSNVRNFTCDICKRAYKTKNQLKNHLQAHSDKPMYKCDICKKVYRWRTNLVNHVKKHCKQEDGTKEKSGEMSV